MKDRIQQLPGKKSDTDHKEYKVRICGKAVRQQTQPVGWRGGVCSQRGLMADLSHN